MTEKKEAIITLFVFAILGAVIAGYLLTKLDDEPIRVSVDRMICYDLHTSFLEQEGWKRATPADRPHMAQMANRGMLEWREEKSLQCHDALSPSTQWLASELWYREKVKRTSGLATRQGA